MSPSVPLKLIDLVRERPDVLLSAPGLSFSRRVVGGWEVLLQRYRWDWFCTYTFKDEIHPEAADKVFRVWMSKLQRAVVGAVNWHKHPDRTVRWARGLEWQKRGVLHYHAVLYAPSPNNLDLTQSRKVWEGEWSQLTDAFASIYPCDGSAAALAYIAKYCGKGGEVDVSSDLPQAAVGHTGLHC